MQKWIKSCKGPQWRLVKSCKGPQKKNEEEEEEEVTPARCVP